MSESNKILDITKALSDELRLRIVRALVSGKPKRYTDIMNDLGMDTVADSSKFAYHMDILVASGIVMKYGNGYAITPGGKEVIQGMINISKGWERFGYGESLKNITGHDIIKVIWARMLLGVSPFWLLFPLGIWYRGIYEYALYMTLIGLVTLSIGAYWIFSLRDAFDNDLWKAYFSLEACKSALGENGKIIDRVKNLSTYSNWGFLFVLDFLALGQLSIGPLAICISSICLILLFISIYWSRMIPFFWGQLSEIKLALDFGKKIEFHSYLVLGFLVIIGTMFITLGTAQLANIGEAAFGYIGAGVGCFGGAVSGWMNFRRKYYGLIE